MKKRIQLIIGVLIILILITGAYYYENAYVLLKPVLTKPTGEPMYVSYTEEMIRNFPVVLKHYDVPYKMNDSGHFLIQAKYMGNRDLMLTMTNCTVDSSLMRVIREQN